MIHRGRFDSYGTGCTCISGSISGLVTVGIIYRYCCGSDIIIGKTANKVTISISHGRIVSPECLIFHTCPVVQIETFRYIPVVSEIQSYLVFMTFIIFRSILVEIIIISVSSIRTGCKSRKSRIPQTYRITSIHRHRLIVHGSVRSIVYIIIPFIQSQTPCSVR